KPLIHPPAPLLSSDKTPPPPQVILVQVNPGESFTIRREDGQFQCIPGPAQVPMMSPNGSVPPIYVPPGYVSQIIEENGVRRVLVLPQQPEFHPGAPSPLHHAPPHAHLPAFIPHPAMMPPLRTCTRAWPAAIKRFTLSNPVSTESHTQHGRPFVHRDDRTSKTYERLQKKLKDRQGGGGGGPVKDSPPPSPQKSCASPSADVHNGLSGKAADTEQAQSSQAVAGVERQMGPELDEEAKALLALLSTISKPEVSDIQARAAVVSWSAPTKPEKENGSVEEEQQSVPEAFSYEVSISFSGKDGKYTSVYWVQAICNCLHGSLSEAASFTTLTCEPDAPNPPRKASGTKNTLVLQWKGKGTGTFEQCYYGPQKQYRVIKLSPASRYSFRLAAKNDMGASEFSEVVDLFTSCSVPQPPFPPELEKAGVTWLCVKWQRPQSSPKEDDIYYILEMEEEGSGYGFQPSYDGEELSCTVRNLHRSTKYKFRVAAYNSEGKSNPSPVLELITKPDSPGFPSRPSIRGRVLPNSFKMAWEPPKDNGGAEVTKYVVELSEGLSGVSWELVYSGPATEHVCEGLKPGCSYQSRVYCMSEGGQSPTPAVPPGPCQPPRLVGKPKAREVQLRWGPPQVDGGSPVSCYSVEVSGPASEESREVYQGSELDCSVSGLLPGKTYSFRLKAANKAGFGPFSERCEITTGPGAPEQCKAPLTTCKSPSCVVVCWETPASNGAPVTEFRLEWGAAEGTMQLCYSGPALSHEMKGLLPATSYFCRVQAVNVAGVGPFSEAVLCQTPCSVPAAITNIYHPPFYSPSTCLGLSWDPPCHHGSPITSYLIDLGERQPVVIGPVSKHVIQNLQPDTSYRIRIQALNSLGAGPFSHMVKMKTKPLPPQPPRLECTAFSHQTLPSDSLQFHLQMGDRSGRFVSLYKGPCHTHKVQRLNESTSYTFRIQAFNEAGEGPFSTVYTFSTPRSPPAPVKAPKVERVDDSSCEVTWEALPPMKGDPIIYTLQCMMGNSDYKQAYKGPSTSFLVHNLQPSSDYRFRVCAIRQCQDAPELSGPYSPTVTLSSQRSDPAGGGTAAGSRAGSEASRSRRSLTDEQCAFLILMLFAIIAILIAFVIQYFVIK
uniref:Fibronectin type III domain containing 3A n=1 Tax=Neogobius melanostomus TaxID=47308 RepID=A0A8C6UIN6_9GOBI